jgi:hypothetical protein
MSSTSPAAKRRKTGSLLRDADSDDEEDNDSNIEVSMPSSAPWMIELNRYLVTNDVIPLDMTVVEWWGVRSSSKSNGSAF